MVGVVVAEVAGVIARAVGASSWLATKPTIPMVVPAYTWYFGAVSGPIGSTSPCMGAGYCGKAVGSPLVD